MRVRIWGLAVCLAVLAGVAPVRADTHWRGTFSFSEHDTWTGSNGDRFVEDESLRYALEPGAAGPRAQVQAAVTQTSRGSCGNVVTTQTGSLLPGSGNGEGELAVAVRRDGSYGITVPYFHLKTKTHSQGASKDAEGRCVPGSSDATGGWTYWFPTVGGTAPVGSVVLRGTSTGQDSNWIGNPHPAGVAHWNLTCASVMTAKVQHWTYVRRYGVTFRLGACDDDEAGYVDVQNLGYDAITKGSASKRGPLVPAGKSRLFHYKLTPPAMRGLARIFRHHRRATLRLAVRVAGRRGPSTVLTRKIVISR